ncbi:GAF domain-containing protein [uncultured Roseobacter sp.]|uniref:GAF domain-containing protein n=1 Tax=uncultured Roseobacter sp. TaxID=114847 RepID=UPI00262BAD9F|nr:GAF domain-containing protein [uncultured Roseobacter sp.]
MTYEPQPVSDRDPIPALQQIREALDCTAVFLSHAGQAQHVVAAEVGLDRLGAQPLKSLSEDSLPGAVRAMNYPMVIDNVHAHPAVADRALCLRQGICGYLGVPVMCAGTGACCGTLSAVTGRPRHWSMQDTGLLLACAARFGRSGSLAWSGLPQGRTRS